MFIGPADPRVRGYDCRTRALRSADIAVNPCKKKHLTAVRSSGADEALILVTPVVFSLEEAIEFITDDELIEVTPKSIRLRKRILNTELRLKAQSKKNKN